MSKYEEQAKVIGTKNTQVNKLAQAIRGVHSRYSKADHLGLDELVDRFIVRDSESNIQLGSLDQIELSNFTHQSSMVAGEIPS
jgi:hypothetical protein